MTCEFRVSHPVVRWARYLLSWILVRPRRWFFGRCLWRGSYGGIVWLPRIRPRNDWFLGIVEWPNFHWVFFYNTVFRFFRWLYLDAWRRFCRWDGPGGSLSKRTLLADLVQWIGQTTAGRHISSQECYHCASSAGEQGDLSEDDSGTVFILEDSGSSSTPDGTDHWFIGTTICPRCGFRCSYRDGSL